MGKTKVLRRIWLFSANTIKSSKSFSKQQTQLIIELNSSLQHIIFTQDFIKRTLPVIQIEVLARIYELVSGTFGSQDYKEHNYLKIHFIIF